MHGRQENARVREVLPVLQGPGISWAAMINPAMCPRSSAGVDYPFSDSTSLMFNFVGNGLTNE